MKKAAISVVAVIALVGCGGPGGNDGGSGGGSGGSGGSAGACADPTNADYTCTGFTTVVKTGDLWTNVINPKCVSTCHKPGGADVSYGDYSTAAVFQSGEVGVKSLYAGSKGTLKKVDPNNPQNSAVWLKIMGGGPAGKKGPQCENPSNQMPDGLPALTQAEKDQVRNWICTGATQ